MFSDPVVGKDFFGRQDIVDLLFKRASSLKTGYRQNVAIIGHQQLGKTSILRHFLEQYQDPDVLTLYIEIKLQALDFFIDQFVRSLLFQFLIQKDKVSPSESLEKLTEKAAALIPKTVSRIREIANLLKQRHPEEAYAKLFELTTIIRQETGKHCIVVLDEFHRLGEFAIKNAFSDFGKRIMVQKDTMYLLSSSSFSASRKILAEKLTLLFGHFERIYLEPFDFETSLDFIENKLQPLTLGQNLKYFLVSFTDGHPFFLDTTASRLKECALANKETQISKETAAETIKKLLFDSQGVLNQYFLKLISPWSQSSSKGSHLLILTELAKGRNKLSDLSASINRSQRETLRQIEQLMEHELILKTGTFYYFHNKLFKFWLKEVYEKKELSLLGVKANADEFNSLILRLIDEYDIWLSRGAVDHVRDLFSQFRDELVEFGEKRRKLPHFTEVISWKNDPSPDEHSGTLIARGNGRCWVCKIVEEKTTEKQVLDFIEKSACLKRHAPTKVLVPLSGLEENAKLLAKEKHILTLGLSRINLLMDLYGKSSIVHDRRRINPIQLPLKTDSQ